jgi:hypothetical protein
MLGRKGTDDVFGAGDQDAQVLVRLKGASDSLEYHLGQLVPAHRVDTNGDHSAHSSSFSRLRPERYKKRRLRPHSEESSLPDSQYQAIYSVMMISRSL